MTTHVCHCEHARAVSLRFRRRVSKCGIVQAASSTDHHSKDVTYIHRNVKTTERVESRGCVVIHGSVDKGAKITAAGDVMVWGRLAGHVHAGCDGDRGATISALELRGAHLTIANVNSLAAARVTVPGPHTARVVQAGRRHAVQLLPLDTAHPRAAPAALAKSFTRQAA
eukprot:GHRQ01006543.1.p1 GENE.GHRQ01006543.1~~GHRQ01006543.1.p1  ORF type:complete len:169 (+),score=22.29 GHRQ01006543.1:67-573(+)